MLSFKICSKWNKTGAGCDFLNGFGDEFGAVFDVFEVNEFAGAVHVAQRNADEASGYTGSAELHGVSIGTRSAGFSINLNRNFLSLGGLDQ